MDEQMRKQMMENYLKGQQRSSPTPSVAASDTAMVPYNDPGSPDQITLEEFKNYVKKWMEYDAFIKKASEIMREKKRMRNKLSEIITGYMCKYNIEDLNTKEGRIRCKTSVVKAPVSQKVVKQRIADLLGDKKEVLQKIYEDREQVEKVSLRRLKIT